MKKWIMMFLAVNLLAPLDAALAAHEYTGVKMCSMCHKKPEQGEQLRIWQESAHSKAYQTLTTPAAKETAAKLGIEDPTTSGKCLKCHATAYGLTEQKVTQKVPVEEGVSCESCHGAGKDYAKKSIMENRDAAMKAGMEIPTEATCVKCHNEENPNFRPFNFAERWEKIKHPVPNK
ncbi:MAG: cytochrome c family protein [Candidatus Omnitrophica bacterium]|nr:cytochrome c family protein [Candidatus Omnitrophota bacterium]